MCAYVNTAKTFNYMSWKTIPFCHQCLMILFSKLNATKLAKIVFIGNVIIVQTYWRLSNQCLSKVLFS